MSDFEYNIDFDDIADAFLTENEPKPRMKISLELIKKPCFLDNLVLLEYTDPNLIQALIQSKEIDFMFKDDKYIHSQPKQLYENVIHQLNSYLKLYNKKLGSFKIKYKKTSKHQYGRVFPANSLGFTSFSRKIRNTLLQDNYIDFDMKNAQPEIIKNICETNDITIDTVKYYCNNRDTVLTDVMSEYGITRKDAKDLFLMLAFFGSFKGWCKNNNVSNTKPLKIITDYKKDISNFYKIIKQHNRPLYETAKKQKTKNIKGSFLSMYLQEYETRIMDKVVFWLSNHTEIMNYKNTDYKIGTYEFDGIKLLKHNVMEYGSKKIIKDIETMLLDETGFIIKFEEKPIEGGFDIKYEPSIKEKEAFVKNKIITKDDGVLAGDDMGAGETILKQYKDWVFCQDVLYVFDRETGMWSSNKSIHRKILKSLDKYLQVIVKCEDTFLYTGRSYARNLTLINNALECLKSLCINDNWLKQKESSSLKMLLFNNGYIDFTKGFNFYDKETYGFNADILFMYKIDKDFVEFNDEDMDYVNDIKKRLFYSPLGEDVGNYYILNLARGLMGDCMKRILFGLGTTDCGKTILAKAIELSLGGYAGSFNAENLLYRKTSNDEAQLMRWALLLRFKRIIISNEMKSNSVMNGNMLKKVSSGGDSLTGRLHCGNETNFTPHFLTVSYANDLQPIKPYDKAVDNRVRIISYKKQFVDEVNDEENELQKDHNLENEIKTDKFQSAFIMMLVQAYSNFKESGEPDEPEEVINGKKEWIGDNVSEMDKFLENYEITNDEKDFVPCEDIKCWLMEEKLGITPTKMSIDIKKYCKSKGYDKVDNKYKKLNGKTKKCWFGMKELVEYD